MKPKDLATPFSWDDRSVLLNKDQKIFYVPAHCKRPAFDFLKTPLFENDQPLHVEFCSGNGDWICSKALEHPEINWIAIEKRFDRCRKIWSKMNNHKVNNLFIFCGMGEEITEHYLKNLKVAGIYINFPDPWPKNKHAKNRIIQSSFCDLIEPILDQEGFVQTLTDDPTYAKRIISCFLKHPKFESLFSDPYYKSEIDSYGSSYFYKLWLEKRKSFYLSKFKKS